MKILKTLIRFFLYNRNTFIFDANEWYIRKFVESMKRQEDLKNHFILDAGAGEKIFKSYFRQSFYQSCDWGNSIYDVKHDFYCDLKQIPVENNTYNAILCTEVLEHVENPLIVLKEFHRILKRKGRVYITVPQCWGVHESPYNFRNYVSPGLDYLFKEASFKVEMIQPKGGIFVLIGRLIREIPNILLHQYLHMNKVLMVLYIPFLLLFYPLTHIFLPLVMYGLDVLDFKKDFTLGYCCIIQKK